MAKEYVIDNPNLIKEWNWHKNNELGFYPDKITCGSGKKVWWKCSKGHEWEAIISNRVKGRGFPYCAGQKVICGKNDLQTVNSKLASEWNFEKNVDLAPSQVMLGSNKKVWWKCNKGHEWKASVSSISNGRGCPYCKGRLVLPGFNDLETLRPDLLKEWEYSKNTNLKPNQATVHSGKKAWWRCEKGHEWYATIDSRTKGHGCPICGHIRTAEKLRKINRIPRP